MTSPDDLADDLAAALRAGDVRAAFQPQVSVQTGAVVAAEALCRWTHPTQGDVEPLMVIRLAEQTGLIHELGRTMLRACMEVLEEWRAAGHEWEVAVNVSPLQLLDESFAREIDDELRQRDLAPARLTLEITENLPVMDAPSVLPRLRALRELGVGISLDEFGSGHASLEQLESLPLTEVKIAGSLIRAAETQRLGALRENVEVARERGLRVVAEGIETQEHLDVARELRCDRAQGYLIQHPVLRAQT